MQVEYKCTWDDESVVIQSEGGVTWMEQAEVFVRFLKACGWHPPEGELQFVTDEEIVVSEDEYNSLISSDDIA